MLFDLKLYFLLQFAFVIEGVNARAKTRWYYNKLPKYAVKAFTLAEILLTLTIIGVVASLTVPSLIQSEQQAQFNAGAWTAFNMFYGAVQQIQNGTGIVDAGTGDHNGLRNQLCSALNCVRTDTIGNIFGGNYYAYKYPATVYNMNGNGMSAALLSNGMIFSVYNYGSCAGNYGVNACAEIWVDTNGNAGPNMGGEDVVEFFITYNNGFYSLIPTTVYGNTCMTNQTGIMDALGSCTYQRLYNPNGMP